MNRRHWIPTVAVLAIACSQIVRADPPDPAAAIYTSLTCSGTQNVCFTYPEGDKEISVPGNLVKIESDGVGQSLTCGSGEVSANAIFLHTPGSTSNGVGYVGADVCLNLSNRSGAVLTNGSTGIYSNVSDWRNALP